MDAPVQTRVDGSVAIIALCDAAKKNALSNATVKALLRQLRVWENDEAVGAVVITGTDGVFSSGADLTDRKVHTAKSIGDVAPRSGHVFDLIAGCSKPTIAAVNGPAIGAGATLALACDLRICAAEAWTQWPQVRFGIMPGSGVVARLAHVVGSGRALDWSLTGRRIDADEGWRSGLHMAVHDAGDLLGRATETAQAIAESPSTSVRFIREAIGSLVRRDVAYTSEADVYRSFILYNSHEREEAASRWLEKRAERRGTSATGDAS